MAVLDSSYCEAAVSLLSSFNLQLLYEAAELFTVLISMEQVRAPTVLDALLCTRACLRARPLPCLLLTPLLTPLPQLEEEMLGQLVKLLADAAEDQQPGVKQVPLHMQASAAR